MYNLTLSGKFQRRSWLLRVKSMPVATHCNTLPHTTSTFAYIFCECLVVEDIHEIYASTLWITFDRHTLPHAATTCQCIVYKFLLVSMYSENVCLHSQERFVTAHCEKSTATHCNTLPQLNLHFSQMLSCETYSGNVCHNSCKVILCEIHCDTVQHSAAHCNRLHFSVDVIQRNGAATYWNSRPLFLSTYDWWLGPLPRSPGTGERGDWCSWPMGVKSERIPRACHCHPTRAIPASLGYPLSIFNKNSSVNATQFKALPHTATPSFSLWVQSNTVLFTVHKITSLRGSWIWRHKHKKSTHIKIQSSVPRTDTVFDHTVSHVPRTDTLLNIANRYTHLHI